MQRPLTPWLGAAVVCASLASACGSSNSLSNQLSPSGGVSLSGLTLTFSTPTVGSSVQAVATATFSNGGTTPVASGFGTDTPGVATVSSTGGITGVAIGDVTIFVDYQGMRASKRVRVLPGYGGTFGGTYVVSSCVATGDFVSTNPDDNFCTGITNGLVLSFAMQSTQSADLTSLTGLFALSPTSIGSGSGTVSSAGVLTYSGGLAFPGDTTRVDFRNFIATSPAPGRISGSFEMLWTDPTLTGSGVITCTNLDLVRQSAVLAPPASPQGRRSLLRQLRLQ